MPKKKRNAQAFLSLEKYKKGSGPRCKFISYPQALLSLLPSNIFSYPLRSLPLRIPQSPNMYVRLVSAVHLSFPLLASAAAFSRGGVLPLGSCDPEELQCCHSSHAVCISSTSVAADKFKIQNILGHK